MKFSVIGSIASALSVLAGPVPSSNDSGPDPSQVSLYNVSYGGTGCPTGTVTEVFSDDRQTVTLIFDQYVAVVGPGVEYQRSRRNCQLNLALQYPQGWQFTVFKADYRGFAGLDTGVNGVQKSTYYFSGSSQQASTESDFHGQMEQDYVLTDYIPITSTVWSPCGGTGLLNINSQVRVSNFGTPGASGQLTTDSIDGKFNHVLGIQWRKC